MLKTNKLKSFKVLFFLIFLFPALYSFYVYKNFRLQQKRQAINSHIGKKFPAMPLQDINGIAVQPDLSATENTIIDFWYRNCLYCLAEMKQFETMLRGKEKQLAVISVSIDDADTWQSVLRGNDQRFAFLSRPLPNWHQFRLNYQADSGQGNNAKYLAAQLNITSYPAFFVVAKDGTIRATPQSAVAYIHTAGNDKQSFPQFLSRPGTWLSPYMILFLSLYYLIYIFIWRVVVALKK